MVVPVRSLGIRHLTNDELPRGDLVAYVLKTPLACVLLSFACCFGHPLVIVAERGFCSCPEPFCASRWSGIRLERFKPQRARSARERWSFVPDCCHTSAVASQKLDEPIPPHGVRAE